jgi:hypothetical protein
MNIKNMLKFLGNLIIKSANVYDKYMRKHKLTDTQYFINWQDAINEISIR